MLFRLSPYRPACRGVLTPRCKAGETMKATVSGVEPIFNVVKKTVGYRLAHFPPRDILNIQLQGVHTGVDFQLHLGVEHST